MDYTTRLLYSLMPLIEEQIRSDLEQGKPESISDMERRVRRTLGHIGRLWLREWLEQMDGAYPESQVSCPCGEKAEYVRRREGVIITPSTVSAPGEPIASVPTVTRDSILWTSVSVTNQAV